MKFQLNTKTYFILGIIMLNICYVLYQVSYGSKKSLEPTTVLANQNFEIESKNTESKRFDLLPINKDPFLGTIKKKTVARKTKRISKKKETSWPSISYSGLVATDKDTSKIFIITINGQQVLLSKGDTFQEIKLISGTATHIRVRYQGETRKIEM